VEFLYYLRTTHLLATLWLAGFILLLGITSGLQGTKFEKMFYDGIYEAIVAETIKPEDFFVRATPSAPPVANGQSAPLIQEIHQ
jgi:hypothetical protein